MIAGAASGVPALGAPDEERKGPVALIGPEHVSDLHTNRVEFFFHYFASRPRNELKAGWGWTLRARTRGDERI